MLFLMDFCFKILGAIGANTLLGIFWVVFCNNYGMVLNISKDPFTLTHRSCATINNNLTAFRLQNTLAFVYIAF